MKSLLKDWVGYGDAVDFRKFTLNSKSDLTFEILADDATKFTVWKYDSKKKKLVSVQSMKLKNSLFYILEDNPGYYDYGARIAGLQLEAGDYWFSMESTNAKKGGYSFYDVSVTVGGDGNTGDDDWDKLSGENDLGMLQANKSYNYKDWVGRGDAVDFRKFTLNDDASLSFGIEAVDAAKLTVWKYDEKKKKLVSVKSKNLKRWCYNNDDDDGNTTYYGNYEAEIDNLQLEAGDYWFSVESTNAKSEGNAFYSISVWMFPIHASYDSQSLSMPETADCGPDLVDELSFGQYAPDVLADASASALADLDGKSAWLNIASLV